MSNVTDFPGGTTLDINPNKVLEAAVGELQQVVVIGIDNNGEQYIAMSTGDVGQVNLMMDRFKFDLLNSIEG